MPLQWAIPVPLLEDESISSWLVRGAMKQGCDPMVLAYSLKKGWRPFATDSDRAIPQEVSRAAEARAGMSLGALSSASIRPQAEKIAGQTLIDQKSWPWVLAIGARNGQRKGGLQFCADCWRQDAQPYFRRGWRYAFVATCPRHGGLMVDACPRCNKALHPHRLTADARVLCVCAGCRFDLRQSCVSRGAEEVVDFARQALRHMADTPPVCHSFFEWAGYTASLVRKAAREPNGALALALSTLGVDLSQEVLAISGTGIRLEMLTAPQRAALWRAAWPLMARPNRLEALVDQPGLTRSSFLCGSPLPSVFEPLVARLPPGPTRRFGVRLKRADVPRPERAVRGAWVRLQREMRSIEGKA